MSDAWKKQFDAVIKTSFSHHIWIVEKVGKFGTYNSDKDTLLVPVIYDCIWSTNFHHLWVVKEDCLSYIYDSDASIPCLRIDPGLYEISIVDGTIFDVQLSRGAHFKFNSKKRLWVDPQTVIKYCEENKVRLLPWACLYTTTPELVLKYIKWNVLLRGV